MINLPGRFQAERQPRIVEQHIDLQPGQSTDNRLPVTHVEGQCLHDGGPQFIAQLLQPVVASPGQNQLPPPLREAPGTGGAKA